MKKVIASLLAVTALLQAPSAAPAAGSVPDFTALGGRLIMLDPGHGGADPGAVRHGSREADMNLAVALRLEKMLSAMGSRVIMTRRNASDEVGLNERLALCEAERPDVFVSMHHNDASDAFYAAPGFRNYSEVYYGAIYDGGTANSLLAMSFAGGFGNLYGVGNVKLKPGYFKVIRSPLVPSVLIEPFFMGDARLMKSASTGPYAACEAIVYLKSLARYFELAAASRPAPSVKQTAAASAAEGSALSRRTFEVFLCSPGRPGFLDALEALLGAAGIGAVYGPESPKLEGHVSSSYLAALAAVGPMLDPGSVPEYREAIASNACRAGVHVSMSFSSGKGSLASYYYRSGNGRKLAEKIASALAFVPGMKASPDSFYVLSSTAATAVAVNIDPAALSAGLAGSRFMINMKLFVAIRQYLR